MRFLVMFVTAVCVLFLIKLRWPKKKNFYDTVYMRYGQETLKIVRNYDKDLSRFNKASLDIGFLQKCKLFHIYPKIFYVLRVHALMCARWWRENRAQ